MDKYLSDLVLRAMTLVERITKHPSLPSDLAPFARHVLAETEDLVARGGFVEFAARAGDAAEGASSNGPSPRILIVDDDETVTVTAASTLSLAGFAACTATSAAEAVEQVRASHPDAIILDLHMAPANGLDFLRWCRTQPSVHSTPVALLTADYLLDDHVVNELQALRAQLHLKPLWDEDLVSLARQLTE